MSGLVYAAYNGPHGRVHLARPGSRRPLCGMPYAVVLPGPDVDGDLAECQTCRRAAGLPYEWSGELGRWLTPDESKEAARQRAETLRRYYEQREASR